MEARTKDQFFYSHIIYLIYGVSRKGTIAGLNSGRT